MSGAGAVGGGGAGGFAGMSGAGAVGGGGAGGAAGMGGAGGAAGMGGAGGAAGMGGTGGGAGMDPDPQTDLGMGDGSDVITIGDSWMNLGSVGIQQSLVAASGQPYRTYGVSATRMLDGAIPGQYAKAKAENPDITTVVMTGGGNDILQNPLLLIDCPALGQSCKDVLDMVGKAYEELGKQMAADGVQDLIVINYTRNTAIGSMPVDYSWETQADYCANMSPVDCHMIDPDEVTGGTMLRDGIHPTDAHYDLIAQSVYDLMVERGIRR
jgi:hypothetical protein